MTFQIRNVVGQVKLQVSANKKPRNCAVCRAFCKWLQVFLDRVVNYRSRKKPVAVLAAPALLGLSFCALVGEAAASAAFTGVFAGDGRPDFELLVLGFLLFRARAA